MLTIAALLAVARISSASPAPQLPQPPRRPATAAATAAASDLALLVRSSDVDLGEMSAIDAAAVQLRALSLVVRSPGRWRLTVRSDSDFRGASTRAVPAERLKMRVTGGPFLALSRSQTVTLAAGKETSPAGDPVDLDFRLDLGWDDPPGVYSGVLLLTLLPEP